jgi:hypothetical protein
MSDFWYGMIFVWFFIPLLFLWGFTLLDLFHRRDVSGLGKGLWAIAILFFPLIGMLIYFITRPKEEQQWASERMVSRSGPDYMPRYTQAPLAEAASLPPTAGAPAGTAQAMGDTAGQAAATMGSPNPAAAQDVETLERMRAEGTVSEEEYNRLKDQMRAA